MRVQTGVGLQFYTKEQYMVNTFYNIDFHFHCLVPKNIIASQLNISMLLEYFRLNAFRKSSKYVVTQLSPKKMDIISFTLNTGDWIDGQKTLGISSTGLL